MATRVPKNGWKAVNIGHDHITQRTSNNISLSYSGKKDERTILSTSPCEVTEIWPDKLTKPGDKTNRHYFGDNLPILASLARESDIKENIRLVYIDPPYGTKGVFQSRNQQDAYTDIISGGNYIEFLRERLILIRELMAQDGSIYVHLDENMAFNIKLVMDEVFGARNFRNWITRRKCNRKNYTRKTYGNIADYILFYTKTDKYVWNRPMIPWTDAAAKREYQYIEKESSRRYKKVPVHAPGVRGGETGKQWKGMMPPPGKHWQYTPEKLDEMDANGEIYWSATGNPRRKIYFDNSDGLPVQDIWHDFIDAHNQNIAITGYPTEKNPDLLRRIIQASSNPGDLVMDCFAGSGTTLVVAHELGRRWIGIDSSQEAISATLKRFRSGTQPMGDFVSERNRAKRNKKITDCPSLFDCSQITMKQRLPTKHTPILDFRLLASGYHVAESGKILEKWRNMLSSIDLNTEKQSGDDLYMNEVLSALRQSDSRLDKLIQIHGHITPKPKGESFHDLCTEIISQQLSKAAANTINGRLMKLVGGEALTPTALNDISDDELRSTGVSGRKISYLRDLISKIQTGDLVLGQLPALEDREVIKALTNVKGIGQWTADMYLIFVLNRPDVFPIDDAGIRAAMKDIYRLSDDATSDKYISISKKWQPYRSYASRYLWLHRDNSTKQCSR